MVLCSLICQFALAQSPRRYTPPAGPVLPNALNYFRRDVGVLDPYNGFVQPSRQLDQQLSAITQQQRAESRRMEQEVGQIRQSLAAPTGVGAGFMNHGRYFQIPRGQRR